MKEKIRIASGQGFWGDLPSAPIQQVTNGEIDYLVLDYLAEVTMSILQKQKSRDSKKGYATDFVKLMEELLPISKNKNVKIISNAGGLNPFDCAKEIEKIAIKNSLKIKIGIVYGDDLMPSLNDLINSGNDFKNIDTDENVKSIFDKIVSANVYFGASPILNLLNQNVDVVITGRVTDAGMTLAPLMHEFNWKENEFDKLASGIVAGHILECGAQSTGGNSSYDWENIPDLANIGFPIIECFSDSSFYITKHKNTGGRVSIQTVTEQLVYEIGDPQNYLTPDCITDFTSIKLEQVEDNIVKVSSVKGKSPTDFYKVSIAYKDGFRTFGTLGFSWPNAILKAQKGDEIIRDRIKDLNFNEIYSEYIGYNAILGKHSKINSDLGEVMLRIGVHSNDEKSVNDFGNQIANLVLTGPPGVTGYLGNRPKAMEVFSYWPALLNKNFVKPKVEILEVK